MAKHRRRTKVLVATGSRADYGLLRPLLVQLRASKVLRPHILACGMHLDARFGSTIDEIRADALAPISTIDVLYRQETQEAMARYVASTLTATAEILEDLDPDFVVVLGDRAEILGVSLATAYSNRPLVHLHGGDLSMGGHDESARHMITHLAHLHFPATAASAARVRALGQQPWRIHISGALGVDALLSIPDDPARTRAVMRRVGIGTKDPLVVVVQHPVTSQASAAGAQMAATLRALRPHAASVLVIHPNADTGSAAMVRQIVAETKRNPRLRSVPSLPHEEYISLLHHAAVLVGNSSSGIIEAPSLHLPVVNVGIRQAGRERAINVLDVGHRSAAIAAAIDRALTDRRFRVRLGRMRSPYGDGHAARRIVSVLERTKVDERLLQKALTIGRPKGRTT